jgi:methanogenic corrinoid protein MtbC1
MTQQIGQAGRTIRAQRQELAEQIVARQYGLQPDEWAAYGSVGREKSVRDTRYHLAYLSEAISASDPSLFVDYVAWVQTLFDGLGFGDDVLRTTLECTRQILRETLPPSERASVEPVLEAALARVRAAPETPASQLVAGAPLVDLARDYLDVLLAGERRAASAMILDAVQGGVPIKDIYLYVFQPVQREVGRLWQLNRVSVAQEHYSTAATQLVMSQLYSHIFRTARRGRSLVAACVGGELHEIGVRMVADFFEMEGWDTYYLGSNTPERAVLEAIDSRKADVLALSATMTFYVSAVAELIARVREGIRTPLRILVGGYPFLLAPDLWRQVGADGYAGDAQQAVVVANQLVGGEPE